MKKILWVSHYVPYDNVPHAGGQIHNYYLKKLQAQNTYDIRLVSFFKKDELQKIDLDRYEIKNKLICLKKDFWGITRRLSKYNPFNSYANFTSFFVKYSVLRALKEYKEEGFLPDIIILQWTQIVLFLPEIKLLFPKSKIISIEEDVSFQKYERKRNAAQGTIQERKWQRRYEKLKSIEVDSLTKSDLVIVNNEKDAKLLLQNKELEHIWCWCPYFQTMIDAERLKPNKDILFYGAMNREENWKSAIWFIENVFRNILDEEVRFVIVGNRPPQELKKYESDRIKVLGFVEDVTPIFQKSLCLVAPLVMGAGVKIKVIEGLSAGIPVLTNKIGIEGIPAENEKEYFHCETPNNYLEAINRLIDNRKLQTIISKNAKDFILQKYDYEKSAMAFIGKIEEL